MRLRRGFGLVEAGGLLGALALSGPLPDAVAGPGGTTGGPSIGLDVREAASRVRPAYVRLVVERRPEGVDLASRTGAATLTTISGLLIDDGGHVLTMGEALLGADLVSAETDDGEITLCDVVGYDPQSGIGVVKLQASRAEPLELAPDAVAEAGLPVFSLGNPFGLGTTISVGHVTGTERRVDVRGNEMKGLLQVSMAMNPGDQGGPIADAEGRVLGVMLTRYLGQPEVTSTVEPQGISFAVPIARALDAAQSLIEARARAVEPSAGDEPWVGVRVRPIEDDVLQSQLRLSPEQGILVERVFLGSPAMNAGLERHDVVVRFGSERLRGLQHFGALVRSLQVGEQVELVVVRGGERRTLRLVVGAR